MSKLLVIALLLLPLINHGIYLATAWDDQDFFKYCPPSQCSQHGPEIRYPFCLESSNKSSSSSSSCGCAGRSIRKLACSGQDTILVHPVLGPYSVSAIDYRHSSMKLIPLVDPGFVLQQKLVISRSSSSPRADVINDEMPGLYLWNSSLVRCLREFAPGAADAIAGPVSCLSNTTNFFYLVNGYEDMSILPLDCKVVPLSDGVGGGLIPMYEFDDPMSHKLSVSFKERTERILSFAETTVYWYGYYCARCERSGGRCAFSSQRDREFCMPGPHGMSQKPYITSFFFILY